MVFGDLLTIVFFGVFIYLLIKVFVKGVLPGFLEAIIAVVKLIVAIVLMPVGLILSIFGFAGKRATEGRGKYVGVETETMTVTDRYTDRKGRTVTINKKINLGSKAVTKRDLKKYR